MPHMHTRTALLILLLVLLVVPVMAVVSPGRITVYSTPSGAHACIDTTTNCDTTGATFTVEGNAWHTVMVTENGYLEWTENVYVTSDQTQMVDAYLDLDHNATSIQAYITPGGNATVCLDNSDCRRNVLMNESAGISQFSSWSVQFTGVNPGYHTITIESPAGYQDSSQLVLVNLGKITPVNIKLSPEAVRTTSATTSTGSIRVYVDRTGSTICIDNGDCFVNVGGSPGPGTGTAVFNEVTADEVHIITLAADGYKPVSAKVSVGKDQISTVDVKLQLLGKETTVAITPPTRQPTVPPTMPTRAAGLDVIPLLAALAFCSLVILVRKNRE
jgi:hypothetical protein